MALKKFKSSLNVLEAAKTRIKNVFDTGVKIYMSFSSGKDSACLSSLVYDMIVGGDIDKKQLTVVFIDEEGLYPSMVEQTEIWHDKFEKIGVPFLWFCLPFKQVCVIDSLAATESWITWDPTKEDLWMRQPPEYAIRSHPALQYPGQMNYQTFSRKAFNDGICLVGVRTSESLTRIQVMVNLQTDRISPGQLFYPIYDWTDDDVWLYTKQRGLEFPDIYMVLYEAGVKKNDLRLCCFFGDCSTQGLRWIAETDPNLWERIEKREPNAYLALLYWDSEMFRRQSRKRTELEEDEEKRDYKELCKDLLFYNTDKYNIGPDTLKRLPAWRNLFIKTYGLAQEKHYKKMYEGILYGDPKSRVLRILWSSIYADFSKSATKETKEWNKRQICSPP